MHNETQEYVDPVTGEILPCHPARSAPRARRCNEGVRLSRTGSEILYNTPLVSPLLRPPSLKQRVEAMIRSGELAQQIRMAQNAASADDADFEGYDRNFAEDHVVTRHEALHATREFEGFDKKPSQEPPQAPKESSATTLPDQSNQASPPSSEGEA